MIAYHKMFDVKSAIQYAADLKDSGSSPVQIIKKLCKSYEIDLHDAKNVYDAALPEIELRAVIKFRQQLELVISELEKNPDQL